MRFRLLLRELSYKAEYWLYARLQNLWETAMRTFKARVKPAGSGSSMEVTVQAKSYFDAKAMLEAQYGAGSIVSGPMETR